MKIKPIKIILLILCLTATFGSGFLIWRVLVAPRVAFNIGTEVRFDEDFEDLKISESRKRILRVARKEWLAAPREVDAKDYYRNGTKYNDGEREPWCADFVSWVYREAELALKNPHSGGWRIPGIYTLREYLESIGRFRRADGSYSPLAGDIVIYDNGVFGGHTNLVYKVSGNEIWTVGGNENGRIMVRKIDWRERKYGVKGFGTVE